MKDNNDSSQITYKETKDQGPASNLDQIKSSSLSKLREIKQRFSKYLKYLLIVGFVFFILFLFSLTLSLFRKQSDPAKERIVLTPSINKLSCSTLKDDLLDDNPENYAECLDEIDQSFQDECELPKKYLRAFRSNLNILVILDSSGSMQQEIEGQKKIDIAKSAIKEFGTDLPSEANVGLMVYGHKGSNSVSDKDMSCQAIELFYPLSGHKVEEFTSAINSFEPRGWTPIADSFKKAEKIFPDAVESDSSNLIYLVSDGLETCDGDPIKAAKKINTSDVEATVNIIGFNVDNQAQQQLRESANQGGGEYFRADTVAEMKKIFKDRSKRYADIINYRKCLRDFAAHHKERIQIAATKVKNCIGQESEDWLDELNHKIAAWNEKGQIDYSCRKELELIAQKQYERTNKQASEDWQKIYYGAIDNWADIFYYSFYTWGEDEKEE